jgi:hypothetical protein
MIQWGSFDYLERRLVQTVRSARGSRVRGFDYVRNKPVAHAPGGIDHGGVTPELATQRTDVHVNVTPGEVCTLITDHGEHLLPTENSSRLAHQKVKEAILGGRELNRDLLEVHFVAGRAQRKWRVTNDLFGVAVAGSGRDSPQDRSDTGNNFL